MLSKRYLFSSYLLLARRGVFTGLSSTRYTNTHPDDSCEHGVPHKPNSHPRDVTVQVPDASSKETKPNTEPPADEPKKYLPSTGC